MDEKFRRRFQSFCNSPDLWQALREKCRRDVTTLRCTQNSFIDREKSYRLEIAPVPSPVIHTMIGYIYMICRYAELILKDVADCTGHFFIIIG